MTAICTCAAHGLERCDQAACDCWCHRHEDAQHVRPHAGDYVAVDCGGLVDIYDQDGRHLLVLDARLPRALVGRLAAAAIDRTLRARKAFEHGVATRKGAPVSG